MANGILQATRAINLLDAMRRLRKGQREEAGPTAGEVAMQKAALQEQRQTRQYRINKWIDLYNKADGTEKEHIWNMMREDYNSFDQETKRVLSYHLRLSPLGEMERKKRLFFEQKGEIPENKFDPETEQQKWAEMEFHRMDKRWQFESYMELKPPDVPETIQVGKNLYAKREKGGIVQLVDTESERWDAVAEGHKTTKEALALAGFKVDIGTKRTMKNGPMTYETVKRRDLLTGKEYMDITPVMKDVGVKTPEAPKEILEFGSYHAVDEGDETKPMGRYYERYKQLLNQTEMIEGVKTRITPNRALQMTIGTAFPNWNFKMIRAGEYEEPWLWWNYYVRGEKETLVYFPGKLTGFPALGDTTRYLYYDAATDTTYDGVGNDIGTYEEVVVESMKTTAKKEK